MNGFWIVVSILAFLSVVTIIANLIVMDINRQKEAALKAEVDRKNQEILAKKNEEIIKTNFIKGYEEQLEKDAKANKATPAPAPAKAPSAPQQVIGSTVTEPTKAKPEEKVDVTAENIRSGALIVGGMVVGELIQSSIIAVATKAGRKQLAKLAYKAASVGLRAASKVFAKLGLSAAGKLAAFGLKAGTKAAEIAAEQALKQAVKTGAKVGAKQALKAAAVALGPVGGVLLTIDMLSAALDLSDAGGYGKMGTIKTYTDMKESATAELNKAYDEYGIIQPIFKGPDIDAKLAEAELTKRLENPEKYPMVKEMTDRMEAKITQDIVNKIITPEDLKKEDVLANYTSMIDPMKIYKQIMKEMCTSNGGKIVEMVDPMSKYEAVGNSKQNGKLMSTFSKKSAAFCEIECQKANCKSFVHRQQNDEFDEDTNCWLYSDSTEPVAADEKTTLYKKVKDLPENMDVCSFTKETCEKSFNWPLLEGQEYAEFKPVKINSIVDGRVQQSNQDLCVSSNSLMRTVCDSNNIPYDQNTGICKIDETYCKMKGAEWLQDKKTGKFDCAISPGQEFAEAIFGTTITRGLKQVFSLDQYEKCKPNEIDDGYFCRNTSSCDPAKNEEQCLGLCYPKCQTGYHPIGCNICTPDCPPSSGTTTVTDDGATCRTQKCKEGEEKSGELCYPKCKPGYYGVGPVCWEQCPPGWNDYGVGCNKYPPKAPCPAGMRDDGTSCWLDTYGRGTGWGNYGWGWDETLRRCERGEGTQCEWYGLVAYPKCKPGYQPVGCCLCEPVGGPGIKRTIFDRTKCDHPNARNVLGLCDMTKSTYGRTAGTVPETTIVGKASPIGRGWGTPAVTIRVKQRIVPYSSKQNALKMDFNTTTPKSDTPKSDTPKTDTPKDNDTTPKTKTTENFQNDERFLGIF